MCLAILKPAGVTLPSSAIKEGWIGNPGGAGYGYVDDGKVVTHKGFFKLKEFEESYKEAESKYTDSPFLVHFRIPTMGTKGPENTHPFPIQDGILIHNGTLTGTAAKYNEGKSDTALFADMFAKDLTFDFVYSNKKELAECLEYNKVALLYKDKRWVIINESKGVWDNGVWYSNTSYKKSAYPYWSGDYDYD